MSSIRGKAAIVGAVDMVSPTGKIGKPTRQVEMEVLKGALDDAGLSIHDVDGLYSIGGGPMGALELAEYCGMTKLTTIDGTNSGGSSFEIHVEHAAAAIAAGQIEVAAIVFAQLPRSAPPFRRMPGDPSRPSASAEFEIPYGLNMPVGGYALAASYHFAEYGTTSEQLAQIAVSTREWASMNPNAKYQDSLTIEDVVNSEMIASPLHKLDCCLRVDGAGAIIMTTPERAKDLKKKPVYVLGTGTAATHTMISQVPDISKTPGAISGPKAFNMAGITTDDVDLLMAYDSFTITVLLHLEDLGFCKKGEGGAFVADGKLGPGGSLPTNTNGGGLSYCHPGMYGMFLLVEATRQLRGEAGKRQLDNPEIAVAHGMGLVLSCSSTAVLGTEAAL